MPDLVCSAQNCRYNDSMYCCKGDIQVGGEEAKDCRDTCCESFHERTTDSVKDSCGCGMRPDRRIDIRCEAVNCEYNDDCACHADHVDISGVAACRCEETECVTFNGK
ncbi:MAG: DUF1540 domain-containing protein [Lachnospiraceae bacterium]|nr:DUF1540 domain-containing protein [Lachnospiraceae bacterium]